MVEYQHLLGIEFEHGRNDCYELLRRFYRDNFGIELTAYARPELWWHEGLDLYMDHFADEGFRVVDEPVNRARIGDVFLIALDAPVANHCGIYVGNNQILHHRYGKRSNVVQYKGPYRNFTLAHIRHPEVTLEPDKTQTFEIWENLPEHKKQKIKERLNAGA